jgi:Putative transposase.
VAVPKIITKLAKHKKMAPGIFLALHTFGRDLKPNVHFHLSTTSGGLSLDGNKWMSGFYIHHQTIKNMWKYEVVSTLRRLYKKQQLILLPELKHIQNYTEFNKWLQFLYQKSWVVHLQKTSSNHKRNVKYLGNYLKRPPLSETRITNYDGENITYFYHDHHDNDNKSKTMSVFDFIQRLIKHIPDSNFRLIRYYNWLSNRTRGKLLPIIYVLIKQQVQFIKKITWYDLFHKAFGYDPLLCKPCNVIMQIDSTSFPTRRHILSQHQVLAATAF